MFRIAKAIWSSLKLRFVQDSGALLHNLMQQVHAIEQNDMSIDDYYSAFDCLVGSLTSMLAELRGGAATTAVLIGCWDQVRGARFVGRDRLLPLHRRATFSAALRI